MAETPHGDGKSPPTGVVLLPNGLSMAWKWEVLSILTSPGIILQVGFSVVSLIPEQPLFSY